jgi:hypothetical protein
LITWYNSETAVSLSFGCGDLTLIMRIGLVGNGSLFESIIRHDCDWPCVELGHCTVLVLECTVE